MKQVKILHCADVHLGAELTTLRKSAVTRRAEIKKTFMNILKLCQTEKVQLLLIAGDLFDNVHVQENILEELKNGFASLKDTIVAIAPGNHDPLTEDSPYLAKDFWPENIIIFKNQLECREINSKFSRISFTKTPGGFCEGRMTELAYLVGRKHDENQEGNYWTKCENPSASLKKQTLYEINI